MLVEVRESVLGYLVWNVRGQFIAEESRSNPVGEGKETPHVVENGQQRSDWQRKDIQASDDVLTQYLEGKKKQMRRGCSHCFLVASRKTPQDISQR